MANETELTTQAIGNGQINVVRGVAGTGVKDRQVTLQAVPDPGYQFDRWVITKTLPLFAYVNGPYQELSEACASSNQTRVFGEVTLFSDGRSLFVDPDASRPAPTGYYFLVNGIGFRAPSNSYIFYGGPDSITEFTTCPAPRTGGSSGTPIVGGGTITPEDTLI